MGLFKKYSSKGSKSAKVSEEKELEDESKLSTKELMARVEKHTLNDDKENTIRLLRIVAERGDAEAQYLYASFCEGDEREKWLRLAAKQGLEEAKEELGQDPNPLTHRKPNNGCSPHAHASCNETMIDIERALKSAITTGQVEFGVGPTEKAVKSGKAQMVILARNCPSDYLKGDVKVKVHVFEGNNMELGALCGKPFSVSALAVIDKGSSNILECTHTRASRNKEDFRQQQMREDEEYWRRIQEEEEEEEEHRKRLDY